MSASHPSPGVLAKMTGALLTDTWNSVQKLVEDLRPLMLKICRANGGEFMGLRPELISRLQAVEFQCRMAREASNALTKVTTDTKKGSVSAAPKPNNTTRESLSRQNSVQQQGRQTGALLPPQHKHIGHSTNPKADEEAPKFPFSVVKPSPGAQSSPAQSGAVQLPKALEELPLGAVALGASQPLPVTNAPSADAMDAHAQAACHAAPDTTPECTALEPQPSATRQQADEPNSGPTMSAVLAQPSASSHDEQQPLVTRPHDNSGSQCTADADLDNTVRVVLADAVASSLPPAPAAAAQNSPPVLMSMLSTSKRLHSAVSQSTDPAQHKNQTDALCEPLPKKPKLGQYRL